MKLTFLGTSAGEQYPGFWCRCEYCDKARQLGGRNLRKNSCAWLDPDTLIDFPPEIFMQAERFGIPVVDARTILITHSHQDHFYPNLFHWRAMRPDIPLPPPHTIGGPRFSPVVPLRVYGNQQVCDAVLARVGDRLELCAMEVHQVEPFREVEEGAMRFVAVPGNHADGDGHALTYIIQREGKTFLYALDTGWFLPESYAEIARHRYDLVVIEGTFGFGVDSEQHMNFRKLEEVRRLFEKDGLLKPGAPFVASHICPHFTPVHDEAAPLVAEKGITLAYDGMTVEF